MAIMEECVQGSEIWSCRFRTLEYLVEGILCVKGMLGMREEWSAHPSPSQISQKKRQRGASTMDMIIYEMKMPIYKYRIGLVNERKIGVADDNECR